MLKEILQVDPFPDPTHAGQEIENIGLLFANISLLLFMIILMLYLYMKVRDILPILINYLFSIIIGFFSMVNSFIPFQPYFSIFFIIFQSIIFLISVLDYFENKKKRGT